MSSYLRIERVPYEEPYHIQLIWDVSNGNSSSRFDYYDNADSLNEIGKRLEVFPRHIGDVFLYEIGSEKKEDRFAYYFMLRVFTTNSCGSAAIQIRFCNNRDLHCKEVIEYCIQTEPAAINRLGKLFLGFAKLDHEYMAWSNSESYIGPKRTHA